MYSIVAMHNWLMYSIVAMHNLGRLGPTEILVSLSFSYSEILLDFSGFTSFLNGLYEF